MDPPSHGDGREETAEGWWFFTASGVVALILVGLGWILIWPLLWLYVRLTNWPGVFPVGSGVSFMACWLAAVLLGFAVIDLSQNLRHGDVLAMPNELRPWRRWWLMPLAVGVGLVLAVLAWK